MELDAHGDEYASRYSHSNRRHKYDVFLSFRGEDTRKGFTDHLYAALGNNGLITFRDEEGLERGEFIKPSLLQAIEESFSAIVVLSKNYAASTWCLDELINILHSKKMLGLHVFPIFYHVDPSHVRHQAGTFREAFEKHEQKFAHDKLKVQKWRGALKEVADLAGWNSQDWHESELITSVVEMVRSKLSDQLPFDLNDDGLVGIDAKITEFDSVLASTSGEVQFIGIWGMGGLGKTTLARFVYKRICKNYDVHFFLHNVREECAKDGGLIKLQKTLLSHPIRRIGMEVGSCYEGKEFIERMLCKTKVLLVLDDVNDISQLENLAGKKRWFGKGSTIIITTRDQHLLAEYGVVSQYEMSLLSHVESFQLFLRIAFKGNQPNKDFLELSEKAIKFASGLPLALKVFGSFLYGRSKSEWEDALRKIPSSNVIYKILKVSFDGLEDYYKTIFLDIACFFNGMAKDIVMQILENSGLQAKIGIRVLIDKSMVTEDGVCLRVHDMLEEMGKQIVFLESPGDASKRSRIWSLEDANHVLGKKRGTEAVRGIAVRFDKSCVIHLDPEAFSSMSNLKLLIISHFSQGQLNLHKLSCLSNTLKVIEWERFPLDFLPSKTRFNELVHLKMQHSKLKELWKGTQFLQSLKSIDLSYSTSLIRTPNFENTPNLERLVLEGCTKLVEVHPSLGQCKNLVIVDFKGCKSIETLPTKFEMNCLEKFVLSGCSKVKKLPEFGKGMERLSILDLGGTAISILPQSLVNLICLATLNLKECKNLVCLPSDFHKLKAIKSINISGCSKFSRLPENLNENEALERLYVGDTALKEVPSSLNNLKVLSFKGCSGYAQLSSSWNHCSPLKRAFRLQRPSTSSTFMLMNPCFSNLSSLVKLDLSYCNLDDESLPSEISNLSSLTTLDLSGNNFVEFPWGFIYKLGKLEFITLHDCRKLQSLPQLPPSLSIIYASDCPLLNHYVREKQLWEFVEQFEFQTRNPCRTEIADDGFKCYYLNDCNSSAIVTRDSQVPDFFMQPTRMLTITGSEVPPWFHHQNYFRVEDIPYENNVSFKVEVPDSCGSSEWWGIAVCLVLEHDLESPKFDDLVGIFWTYRVFEDENSNSQRGFWIHLQSSCRHQQCIIYIRCSSFFVKQLQLLFSIVDNGEGEKSDVKIGKCGWRVLCNEDIESYMAKHKR